MFTKSDFKMAFGLSIIGSIAATTLILVSKSRKSCFKTTVSSTWFMLHKTTRTCSTSLVFGVYICHLCLLSKTVLSSKGKVSVETVENNFLKERFNQGKEKLIKFGDLKNYSFNNSKRT